MKLSDWARSRGIKYKTAWLRWRDGTLPVAAEQMAAGTILVSEGEAPKGTAGLYAGVSSSDQRNDLEASLGG
jgi:putative resolvase